MTLRECIRNRRGMALMFTLVTFLVVFIILTGVAIVANANLISAQTSQEHTAAYFTAESGINTVSSDLRDLMNDLLADDATIEQAEAQLATYVAMNNNRRLTWNPINGETVFTDLVLSYTDNGNGRFTVNIASDGNVGPQQRTLTMSLVIEYNDGGHPIFSVKNAITALGYIIIGNQARIAEAVYVDGVRLPDDEFILGGPIATYSQDSCAITIGTRGQMDKAPPISSVIIPINNTGSPLNTYKSFVVCTLNKSDSLNDVVGMTPNNGLQAISATGENIPYPNLFIPAVPTFNTRLDPLVVNGTTLISANGSFTKTNAHSTYLYTLPSGQYYVPQLSFDGAGDFTIWVDGTTEILTDALFFRGTVHFTGNGDLTIYVKGNGASKFTSDTTNIQFDNGVIAGWVGAPEKLKIVVFETLITDKKETRDLLITLNNNIQFHGSMLLENADLNVMQNANWTGYLGTMGDSISFNENNINHDGFFYGPNAVVAIDGTSGLVGAIAVKTVTIGNNGFVHYDPTHLRKFPFMILGDAPGGGGVVVDPGGDPAVTISEGTIREGN
jgi:Tfp pilus assembly protein PilX